MVSRYVLPAAIFIISVAFLVVWNVVEWNVVEQTVKELNGTKVIVVQTSDAMAMLSHMKVINSTITGVCRKIYATSGSVPDVLVLICGSSAYVFYLH